MGNENCKNNEKNLMRVKDKNEWDYNMTCSCVQSTCNKPRLKIPQKTLEHVRL